MKYKQGKHPNSHLPQCGFQKGHCPGLGKDSPGWKGNKVKYDGIHAYIRRYKLKPNKCDICNENKKLELSNISGKNKRKLNDWQWICRKCHMKIDGRLAKWGKYKWRDELEVK